MKKLVLVIAILILIGACQKEKSTAESPTEAYKMLYKAVKSKKPDEIKKWISQGTLALSEARANMEKSSVEKIIANGFTETTFSASLPQIRDERINGDFGAIEVWNEKRRLWEDLPFIKEASVSFEFTGDDKSKILELTKSKPSLEITEENSRITGSSKPILYSEAEQIKTKLEEAGAKAKIENVSWRLAVGEIFNGVYKSPGKSQSLIEREAANLANQGRMPPTGLANSQSNADVDSTKRKAK